MTQNSTNTYTINPLQYSLTSKYIERIILGMRYTLKDFKTEYPDDETCLKSVLDNRYGKTCPKCGVIGVKCSECDKHIYPLADTIFRKSETSLWNWFYAIFQFSVSKNGVTAKELERSLGVTYKTAWRMCKQIRLLMEQDSDKLDGDVEMDETYAPSRKHPRMLGRSQKQVIFGVVERGGRVSTHHVRSAGVRVLMLIIEDKVHIQAQVFSDEAGVYKTLNKRGYAHTTVNHSKLEYVRGTAYTNTIEGYWSQLKRSIDGTYHSVSPKYLQSYLNEFAFRYNLRGVPICPILLERAVKLS
jgi:transposase